MRQTRLTLIIVTIVFGLSVFLTDCGNEDSEIYPYVEWVAEDLGSPGEGLGTPTGLALDPSDNKPVVAFKDMSVIGGGRPHVMKWSSGTTWTDLGFLTATLIEIGDFASLAFDPSDNKPIVAFVHAGVSCIPPFSAKKTHIMKWSSGTTWTDLGFLGTGFTDSPVVAIDPSDNKPIVAYVTDSTAPVDSNRANVMKWSSGITWTDMGYPSTGTVLSASPLWHPNISMAIDPSDNKPVVVFVDNDNSNRAHVKKWSSGTTWTDMGFLSTSPAMLVFAIVFDPLDNKPIAGVEEYPSDQKKLHVMKWSSGTSWIDMGYPITGWGGTFSIAIDPSDNKPVIARQGGEIENAPGNLINLMKWSSGTSWTYLGSLLTSEYAEALSIAFDPSDNDLVVMYVDGVSERLRVKKGSLPQ